MFMNKKVYSSVLILMVIISVIITACSNPKSWKNQPETTIGKAAYSKLLCELDNMYWVALQNGGKRVLGTFYNLMECDNNNFEIFITIDNGKQ